MARCTLRFDGLTTNEVRNLIVAHKFATGDGKILNGIGPRVTVEGPECWGLVTEPLRIQALQRFVYEAGKRDATEYMFPPTDTLDEEFGDGITVEELPADQGVGGGLYFGETPPVPTERI